MKFNKWTLGLAAVGAVSLVSAARAEEKAASPMVMTAVQSTTLTGYVDTSIQWDPGSGNAHVPNYAFNAGKADGFNLNAVLVRIKKDLDETEWAAGYDVDLFAGQDAVQLATGLGNNLIKQAYVTVRTPVGTGIDWKLGVFDNWIGYESTESPGNPNFTRSYGYTIEPTTFTGLTGTYKLNEALNFSLGMANISSSAIGVKANPPAGEQFKSYFASVAYTAPSNWGSMAGSSFYAGFINGWNGTAAATAAGVPLAAEQQNYFLGATVNTPVSGLKAGASWDHAFRPSQNNGAGGAATAVNQAVADDFAIYSSYALQDTKWSFHTRGDYYLQSSGAGPAGTPLNPVLAGTPNKVLALTETIQYDLWANVISRLELRWDHQMGSMPGNPAVPYAYGGNFLSTAAGTQVAGNANRANYYTVALNLIYKF